MIEILKEYDTISVPNIGVMEVCDDLGIDFNNLHYIATDPNYSNADSYSLQGSSLSIGGRENRLRNRLRNINHALMNNNGTNDKYYRTYAYKNTFIFFDYSDSKRSLLVIVPRSSKQDSKHHNYRKDIKSTPTLERNNRAKDYLYTINIRLNYQTDLNRNDSNFGTYLGIAIRDLYTKIRKYCSNVDIVDYYSDFDEYRYELGDAEMYIDISADFLTDDITDIISESDLDFIQDLVGESEYTDVYIDSINDYLEYEVID